MHSTIRYVVNEIKLHCNLHLELGKRASKQQPRAGKTSCQLRRHQPKPWPSPSLPVAANLPKLFSLGYC